MKSGFTLIELLIVIALVSILLTILFGSFVQSNKLIRSADDSINFYTKTAIAVHQLTKDISGICIPSTTYIEENKKKEDQNSVISNLFVSTTTNQDLTMLTFISNNPLQEYWSETVGKVNPYLIRIVYRLIPEQGIVPSFKLMRQSDANLNLEAYKLDGTIREYELLNGIKSMSVSFVAIIETQVKNEATKVTKKELTKYKQWNSETGEVQSNNKPLYIPNAVSIKIILWNEDKTRDQQFDITVAIPAYSRIDTLSQELMPSQEELKKTKSMILLPQNQPEIVTLQGTST